MNFEMLTENDIIKLYFESKDELERTEDEIRFLVEEIENNSIGSEQRSEFLEDLKYNKEHLEKINEKINRIEKHAKENNIELIRPQYSK